MIGEDAKLRRAARIHTPTALGAEATRDVAAALNVLDDPSPAHVRDADVVKKYIG
jgi:hypothetical protein